MEFSEVQEVNTFVQLSQIANNPCNQRFLTDDLGDSPIPKKVSKENNTHSSSKKKDSNNLIHLQDLGTSQEQLDDIINEIDHFCLEDKNINTSDIDLKQKNINENVKKGEQNSDIDNDNDNDKNIKSKSQTTSESGTVSSQQSQKSQNLSTSDEKSSNIDSDQIQSDKQQNCDQVLFKKKEIDLENIKQAKSLLQSLNMKKSLVDIEKLFSTNQAVNYKKFKVHYFDTPQTLDIIVNNGCTVQEIIDISLEEYENTDQISEKESLEYMKIPSAYELRLLDDDFTYKADYNFPAIDPRRKFIDLCLFEGVIVKNKNFKPKKKSSMDETLPHLMKIVNKSENEDNILLKIELIDEQITFLIKVKPNGQIKDVIQPLRKKHQKFQSRDYIFYNLGQGTKYVIDLNFPVSKLMDNNLILERRKWADQPKQNSVNFHKYLKYNHFEEQNRKRKSHLYSKDYKNNNNKNRDIKSNQELQQEEGKLYQSVQPDTITDQCFTGPINQVQAYRFEQFDLMRILPNNTKQKRKIGISQEKIFNINIEESKGIIQYLWNTFQTYSLVPDIDIKQVQELEKINSTQFKIKIPFFDAIKTYTFECESEYQNDYILAKIQYLQNIKKKRREEAIQYKSQILSRGFYNNSNFRQTFI